MRGGPRDIRYARNASADTISGRLARFASLGTTCVFFITNIYWGVSGFIKTTYFTCFYLWAKECEQQGASEPELAPAPLAACLAD